MSQPIDDLRRRQRQEWWALGLLLVAVGLLVAGLRSNAHAEADEAERQRLDGQAKATQQILGQQLQAVHGALLGVRDDLGLWTRDTVAAGASRRLKAVADAIPGLSSAALLDSRGRVLAASRLTMIGADFAPRLPPNGEPGVLQVRSLPRRPADSGDGGVADLVLPVDAAEGGGALLATLDPDYFRLVLRSVIYAGDMRAAVVHSSGPVLMFEPPTAGPVDANFAIPGSFFVLHRDSGRDASVFSGRLLRTGEKRLVAMRTLRPEGLRMDAPPVVSLSRSLDAVFAPWRQQSALNIGLYAMLAAGMALLLALLQGRQRTLQGVQHEADARERAEGVRLELALRGADLGLWDHDVPSGRGTINARWHEMLGYTQDEVASDYAGWHVLVHPDDWPQVEAAQAAHLQGRSESYEAVYRMRHRDGRWVWILDRGKVLERGPAGEPLRMVGTHMDISQRMEAEQALRRSEESLAITLQSIGDAVIATDEQGRITRLNATAERLTGWPAANAMGQPLASVFRIFNPHSGRAALDPVQQVLAHGEVVGLANDTLLVGRDGSEIQIADSAAPIRTHGGAIIGVVLVFSDVSERYRAQQALRDRERQLSTIADALPGPVARTDLEGRYLFANAAYLRWFGVPPEQVIGRTRFDVLGEERNAAIEGYVRRAQAGETVRYELPFRIANGELVFALVTLLPDRDPSGRVRGHFTVATDISERKSAEDALRASEQQSRALLDNLLTGVVVHAADTRVLEANPAARRMLGLSLDQMRGKVAVDPVWMFVAEDGSPMAHEQFPVQQVLASGEPLINLVGGVMHPGSVRPLWVLCNAFPVRGPNGKGGERIEQIIVTLVDITERRQAELERQALEAQLRESQKMESIGTLAGGIAHDFNNILAAIIGNVALAREDAGPEHPVQASLVQIQKAGLRARSLVQQILDFSRREPGVLAVQPLRPVVEETLSLLRATLPAAVRLVALLPDEPVSVRADATQLQQVLMNLATNAWHALPEPGGRIEIGFECMAAQDAALLPEPGLRPGPAVHLWVRDNGSGIEAATLSRIFDPFFTTKPVGQGTGLGLSVVHGIVRAHEGAIVVHSTPGEGSSFHLYFPSTELPAASSPAAAAGSADSSGSGEHVLYVDDDEVMVVMAERLLQRAGFRVTTCQGATLALALLRARPMDFDIVVTDFNMPDRSGIELSREIAALRADLPVILSSGLVSEGLHEQARQVGVRAVLKKENSFEELAVTVARVLAQARSQAS